MRDQELIGLWEAYLQVHTQPQEVVEEVEEVEVVDEAMSKYERNRQRAAQRAAARNEARRRGQTGIVPGVGYVTPRPERETWTDESGRERHKTGARMPKKEDQKESFDLFDTILEYLVAEGYADTNENALVIMANMSEDWKQSIVEVLDTSPRRIAYTLKATQSGLGAKQSGDKTTLQKRLAGLKRVDRKFSRALNKDLDARK